MHYDDDDDDDLNPVGNTACRFTKCLNTENIFFYDFSIKRREAINIYQVPAVCQTSLKILTFAI